MLNDLGEKLLKLHKVKVEVVLNQLIPLYRKFLKLLKLFYFYKNKKPTTRDDHIKKKVLKFSVYF